MVLTEAMHLAPIAKKRSLDAEVRSHATPLVRHEWLYYQYDVPSPAKPKPPPTLKTGWTL
jgi:hypothetical protein